MANRAVSRQGQAVHRGRYGTLAVAALRGALVPAVLVLAACSGSHNVGFASADGGTAGSPPRDGSSGGGGGDSTTTSLGGGDGGVGGKSDAAADCPASAKLVYITGIGNKLYSFYPPTFTFTLIGTMTCLDSPTHMTVDRTGTAWVVSDGKIYNASTADASCSAVSTWTPHPGNYADFALTFLGLTTPDTTLYLLGSSYSSGAAELGTFDTSTGTVTTIASPSVSSPQGDMTTNEDGTLYFLMDENTIELYELNPSTGAVMKSMKPSAAGGGDQALAYWGGSFYAFENNVAYQYDPTKNTTTKLGNAPIQVTGAGQSTCVPTVPPPSK
jgi:hypothetical protein